MQEGFFKKIGILVGMSIIQGGSGYPFFSPSVYEYICGKELDTIRPALEEVPNLSLQAMLSQVICTNSHPCTLAQKMSRLRIFTDGVTLNSAVYDSAFILGCFQMQQASDKSRIQAVAMEAIDTILSCGYTKPIASLDVSDVPQLVRCVVLHKTILEVKGELDQFMSGLEEVQVLQYMQHHPGFFQPLFLSASSALTFGEFKGILS